jgi:hypothetical protein
LGRCRAVRRSYGRIRLLCLWIRLAVVSCRLGSCKLLCLWIRLVGHHYLPSIWTDQHLN